MKCYELFVGDFLFFYPKHFHKHPLFFYNSLQNTKRLLKCCTIQFLKLFYMDIRNPKIFYNISILGLRLVLISVFNLVFYISIMIPWTIASSWQWFLLGHWWQIRGSAGLCSMINDTCDETVGFKSMQNQGERERENQLNKNAMKTSLANNYSKIMLENDLNKRITYYERISIHTMLQVYILCFGLVSCWLDDSVRLEFNWSWSDSDSWLSGSAFREWRRRFLTVCKFTEISNIKYIIIIKLNYNCIWRRIFVD